MNSSQHQLDLLSCLKVAGNRSQIKAPQQTAYYIPIRTAYDLMHQVQNMALTFYMSMTDNKANNASF